MVVVFPVLDDGDRDLLVERDSLAVLASAAVGEGLLDVLWLGFGVFLLLLGETLL